MIGKIQGTFINKVIYFLIFLFVFVSVVAPTPAVWNLYNLLFFSSAIFILLMNILRIFLRNSKDENENFPFVLLFLFNLSTIGAIANISFKTIYTSTRQRSIDAFGYSENILNNIPFSIFLNGISILFLLFMIVLAINCNRKMKSQPILKIVGTLILIILCAPIFAFTFGIIPLVESDYQDWMFRKAIVESILFAVLIYVLLIDFEMSVLGRIILFSLPILSIILAFYDSGKFSHHLRVSQAISMFLFINFLLLYNTNYSLFHAKLYQSNLSNSEESLERQENA